MKLADKTVETHTRGTVNTNQFSISQTSKMFRILSDSLYSDKIQAVIRELSTNAYDSHIASGNKNPFKVTLPTAANPSFVVRDYGTGLSKEDMESLYTTYGASNKNHSNDFVGCLGLGSKSPFAYTKSFSASSYFNGTKYTYVASIDESGVPALNLFNISDTDEPNGLEISFAVKQNDFHEFSSKAVRIFHYFKMKPIIEGGVLNNLKDHEYSNKNIVISGDGWRVCRLSNDTNKFPNIHHKIDSGIVALMGNIAYPVVASQLIGEQKAEQSEHIQRWNRAFGKADIDSWKSFVSEILDQNLYLELDFGIGEVEIDASREGLQYTKDVIKTLRNKTQDIYMEMKDEFSKKISSAKTKIEAIQTYYTMNDLAGGWGVGATWTDPNGKTHNINTGQDIEYKFGDNKNLYVINYRTAGYRSRRMVYLTNNIHINTLTGKGEYYYSSNRKTGKLAFFVCDVKSEETAKKIAIRYCNDNDCFAYLMIDSKNIADSDKGFDSLISDVGSHNIQKISAYKDLIKSNNPRKNSTRDSKGSVSDQDVFFIYGASSDAKSLSVEYNDATYLKSLSSDELDEFADSEDIVYIPITRYKTTTGMGFPEISNVSYMITDSGTKGIIKTMFGNTKIYAIKSSLLEKMKKDSDYNMISFNEFFKDKLETVKSRFEDIGPYNSLVEYCRKEFGEHDHKETYRYYNYGTVFHQFSYHMLNIFGLDYGKFIKNKTMVDAINYYMIMEFFSDTVHRPKHDMTKFNQTDYSNHMDNILKEIGIENVDSQNIRTINVEYNCLVNMIEHRVYSGLGVEEYLNLIKTDTKKVTNKIPKTSEIRKNLKEAIDNNPMIKYIMGSHQVNGSIRDLTNKNPISALEGRNNYYASTGKDWFSQMTNDSLELFKIQLSSLIK